MANKEIHELINSEGLSDSDVLASQENTGGNVWVTRKFTLSTLGLFLNTLLQYASALHTTNKTITGAINEIYDSSASPALNDLSDVDIDSSTLAAGQTIIYNGISGKFENGSASGGSHSYSTTEQVVGTWIDGSTIYERTIELSSSAITTANQWTTISGVTLTNEDAILKTEVYLSADKSQKVGFGKNNNGDFQYFDTIQLSIDKVTIQYTKTSS